MSPRTLDRSGKGVSWHAAPPLPRGVPPQKGVHWRGWPGVPDVPDVLPERLVTLLARDLLTSGGEPWPTLRAASNLSQTVFFVFFPFSPFFLFLLKSGGKQPMLSQLKKWNINKRQLDIWWRTMAHTRRCRQPKSHRFSYFCIFHFFIEIWWQAAHSLLKKNENEILTKDNLTSDGEPHSQQPMSDLPTDNVLSIFTIRNMQIWLTISLLTWWSKKDETVETRSTYYTSSESYQLLFSKTCLSVF